MNPSRSRSLKNSFSLEYITHYCISCRNQMQTLYSTTEQIGFVEKNAQIMTFCFSLASSFYFVMVIVLFSFFVLKQQFLWHPYPWVWARAEEKNVILTLVPGHRVKVLSRPGVDHSEKWPEGPEGAFHLPCALFWLYPPLSYRLLTPFILWGQQSQLCH